MKILVIIGSTRINRNGERVKKWLDNELAKRSDATYEIVDLRDVNLPFYDEPKSINSLGDDEYNHPETKAWGDKVASAQGFIFVTPEYNHGPPATIKNAIDYAWRGWNYKPMSVISYSTGQIGGARATEQLRLMSLGVKLLPLPTAVHIAHVTDAIAEDGKLQNEKLEKSLNNLCSELIDVTAKLQR